MEDRFQVGIVSGAHGVSGEVRVFPTTDDPRRFSKLKRVYLEKGREKRTMDIVRVKYSGQRAVLRFQGVDTVEEAEKLRGASLYVPRQEAIPLEEGEYFIADLIGMQVVAEDGADLGVLRNVIETGANDVYEIEMRDGRQLLLPAIHDCILQVDVEAGRMRVRLLDGLL